MKSNVVLAAQKFCAEHFCDNNLNMENYMSLVDTYLEAFEVPEDKVQFLIEVKRIGKVYITDAMKQIEVVEVFDLSKSNLDIY